MAREYSPLLVAALLCVALTGTVVLYGLLMDEVAPRGQPEPVQEGPGRPVMTGRPVTGASGSFSISVTPATATARSGDAIRFTLTVLPENGFSEPVQVRVSATALGGVYRDTRDLAMVSPPYPPLRYEFAAPDLPPLVSTARVDATVTASGGGLVRTEQVQLVIRR
ncbi:hypothetical protein F8E02_06330 [Methanoculleus sp. Wushi-C6]|uniref:DUF1616 domain-containing protein n=1 Tax=Methanoculleus caldifontis TaxID=2651577 RepID=A0ABU3X0P9_9EURY|nr:hypothetical protein [Methanoculleus sp. Wushi-C6]MDV2481629.1 hypothetical protein [Methanoculleus sp. Wushi-C6]